MRGRDYAGRIGTGAGFDVYKLRESANPYIAPAQITRTGDHYDLVGTADGGEAVGDDEGRASLTEAVEAFLYQRFALGI